MALRGSSNSGRRQSGFWSLMEPPFCFLQSVVRSIASQTKTTARLTFTVQKFLFLFVILGGGVLKSDTTFCFAFLVSDILVSCVCFFLLFG
ncbi:hypothetical protein FN846DRAFT_955101 [Sphaerosporella brunnea]|uniref:Uncharacterized protein n=1 Tax=Sphaerosporella brunnea TaxID=1250544 RepID=A0A5J5ET00_9PEZI|nr:hypothetical protein FN846DRAFT_955101 [Sphaerosporella brunnea]